MAHLWIHNSMGEWVAMTLNGEVITLTNDGLYPASLGQEEKPMQDAVFILSFHHLGKETGLSLPVAFRKRNEIRFNRWTTFPIYYDKTFVYKNKPGIEMKTLKGQSTLVYTKSKHCTPIWPRIVCSTSMAERQQREMNGDDINQYTCGWDCDSKPQEYRRLNLEDPWPLRNVGGHFPRTRRKMTERISFQPSLTPKALRWLCCATGYSADSLNFSRLGKGGKGL